jgi:LuxR family quorum sensing-dependent transcriptional regulator
MANLHLEVLEFVTKSERHQSLFELNGEFTRLVSTFGFPSFIFTGLPRPGEDVEPLVISNHWPAAWTERYRQQQYFSDDPVSRWSLSRRRPFLWREAQRLGRTTRGDQISGEAWEHGLADGIAYPLRDVVGGAVISLASDYSFRADDYAQASLFLACSYFRLAAEELTGRSEAPLVLTPREIEVAHWAAAGKTAWETSEILAIAEATVRAHLASLRDKLSVITTTQAVAKLALLGIIQL